MRHLDPAQPDLRPLSHTHPLDEVHLARTTRLTGPAHIASPAQQLGLARAGLQVQALRRVCPRAPLTAATILTVLVGAVVLIAGLRPAGGAAEDGPMTGPARAERREETGADPTWAESARLARRPALVDGPAERRLPLDELAAALAHRDEGRLSRLVTEYFAAGPAAIDGLLAAVADPSTGAAAPEALAALLKAAAYLVVNDPARFAPWTPRDLASQFLELMGSGDHVPRVLRTGFDELGVHLGTAEVLRWVELHVERPLGPPLESQVPSLELGRMWARSAPAEVERELLTALEDGRFTGEHGAELRTQTALLLVHRDPLRLGPELLAAAQRLDSGEADAADVVGGAAGDAGAAVRDALASGFANVATDQRGAYFTSLANDPELALRLAWELGPDEARDVLGGVRPDQLLEPARDWLAVRAGTESALAGGDRLLAAAGEDRDLQECLVIGSWLHSDWAVSDELAARLAPRFEARAHDGGRFWSALHHDVESLQDHQVIGGVLPWLERSRGDGDPVRASLVATLRQRYPAFGIE